MPRDAITEIDLKRDVVDLAVDLAKMHIRVALAGAVASFERTTSRAWVNLKTRFIATNFQPTDEPQAEDLPVIHPAGDGYGFWFNLAETDPVVVLCCDSPVRGFYESGEAVTPSIGQGHSPGTAVALPGGRVSSSQPGAATPPPNGPAEAVAGGGDLSAAVIFRRASHPASPTELGTVVVAASAPTAGVRLASDTATRGVARLDDAVARTALMTTWMSQVTTAINTLAPGSVTPFPFAAIGNISSASTRVVTE